MLSTEKRTQALRWNNLSPRSSTKRLRILPAAVFVGSLLISQGLVAQSSSPLSNNPVIAGMNREISADFMAELLSGIEHSPGRLEELLRSALEYNAENSDALYYLGRKRIREGRVLEAEDLIRRALESEDWLFTPPVDAIAEHVDILLRLKRFDTIRSSYVASDRWVEFLNNPGILIDLIDALYRMGDHGLADQIMNRARARYPDDMRLRALAVTRPDPPLIGDYQWLKAVWQSLPEQDIGSDTAEYLNRAMLHYLFTMEPGAQRAELLETYRSKREFDILSEFLVLEEMAYNQRNAYLRELEEQLLLDDYLLLTAIREVNLERSEDSEQFFSRQFRDFPLLRIDLDRNGESEAELQYLNDTIHWIRSDWNQDNIWEREILLREDENGYPVPYALVLREPGRSLEIIYDRYPDVHHAQLTVLSEQRREQVTYFLSGERFRLPAVDFRNDDYQYVVRDRIAQLLDGRSDAGSLFIYARPDDSTGFYLRNVPAIESLIDDFSPYIYLVESRYARDNEGEEVHQSRFDDGELLAARYDIDGDGDFELLHYFSRGQLQYSLRSDDDQIWYLARYDDERRITEEQLIPANRFIDLPRVLQPARSSAIWSMPEY
jgi:hypothetical protein